MRILLAGAGGQVGRRVAALLEASGHDVLAITGRKLDLTKPGAARGLGENREAIVSCAGASVSLAPPDKRGYREVDPAIHRELILEAKRCGIKRFVYLGVHTAPHYANCSYILAHEEVRQMLQDAELDFTVIRPTGIYSAFNDLLAFAEKGVLPLVGSGKANTNPIDPQDVADLIFQNLSAGPRDLPCGGPEILSRREINLVVANSVGRPKPFMPRIPAAFLRFEAKIVGTFHPRMAELMEFFSMVASDDAIAPPLGTRPMSAYFPAKPR